MADHLNAVSCKINDLLGEKVNEVSETKLRVSCIQKKITQLVDEKLASNGKTLKTTFGATELKVDGDFLYFLADAAAIAAVCLAACKKLHEMRAFTDMLLPDKGSGGDGEKADENDEGDPIP